MQGNAQEADFDETPEGQARRWSMELSAARKELEKFHSRGDKVIKRFRDERPEVSELLGSTRLNAFSSDVQTLRCNVYGAPPRVNVSRRFADAGDDDARVAGEQLERILNTDIERDSDSYATALSYALDDRLLPGFGNVRVRYVADFEKVPETPAILDEQTGQELSPAVPAGEKKTREDVETDHVHWNDQLWSPSRVFHEVRWWAFKLKMSRDKLKERFGEEVGKAVPLNAKKGLEGLDTSDADKADPWGRAEVWEIWDKEHKRVIWYVDGYPKVLDSKADTLGLEGFWPFPRPLMANLTTSGMVPVPDFYLNQDLYNEIDEVTARISALVRKMRLRGVYDKTNLEIKNLLADLGDDLVPAENFGALSEKGGLRGVIDWLPLDQMANAILALRDYRRELIDLLHQTSGMSDIMRGQGTQGGVTATEQRIKARSASVRIQALQDEFARFASDVQRIKAEIISKHFDEATILERCNCANTADAGRAQAAVALIKSGVAQYRIEVKPESISMQDFGALRQEKTEVLTGIASYFQAMAPLAQQMPQAMPTLLQILQWSISGLRGASTMEGILDQAVEQAKQAQEQAAQNPQPPPPDPKVLLMQMKGQQDLVKIQAETQARQVELSAEVEADRQRETNQAQSNVSEHAAKQQISAALRPPPKPNGGFLP
jgi:hypothetical protein